jgi:aldose 1-epimerase
MGNAIHGFVMRRPWRVTEHSGQHITGEFHAWRDDPSLKARWPADFRITAAYRLSGSTLRLEFVIENPGDVPLPFGFGTHPYFRVPLGGPSAADCLVRLPVTARWELDQLLPTGRRLELGAGERFDAGRRFGDLQLDDGFTGLTSQGGVGEASISDPAGATMRIRWPAGDFRECVAYTPPHREAICIEPLTCAAGAAALAERGIDGGWRTLPPAVRFSTGTEIGVS